MSRAADVAVIGAGVVGLATARELALQGRQVILLEQFTFGHSRGSSHGETRVFKLSYPDVGFVSLAQHSIPLWRQLEEEGGEEILSVTGSIDIAEPDELDRRCRALVRCGAPFELLAGSDVQERFGLSVGRSVPALLQPGGGVLHADRALRAFLSTALANGAELRTNTMVRSITADRGRVRLETTGGDLSARFVVVAAGAWARRLVEPCGLSLDVVATRETVAYFRLPEPRSLLPLSDWRPASRRRVTYALPTRNGTLKVGLSGSGREADPDEEGQVDADVLGEVARWAALSYGVADDAIAGAETCLYTSTSDERFLLERHGRLVVGSACSGHGFKFAPTTGKHLADLVNARE